MRTLLNECLPPNLTADPTISLPEQIGQSPRTFSKDAVLTANTAHLLEVGLDGTVIATPGARADQANSALGRGVAPTAVNHPSARPRVEQSEEISTAV